MNCTEARNDLVDLVVGALSEERRQHSEAPMPTCPGAPMPHVMTVSHS